jgi:carboxymethylenebutenolidase
MGSRHPHRAATLFATLVLLAAAARGSLAAGPGAAGGIPAQEDSARAAIERSPRHAEYVDVAYEGQAPLRSYVVYPERKDKAGVVLVLHEIFGLTDWIKGVADRLAADGFIAVAPDLLSGMGPGGGGTDSLPSRDEVVKAVRALTPEESAARIAAVRGWAVKLPAANGRLATLGFCWGGARSFAAAAASPPPDAAVVYYGSSPDSAALEFVQAPVQGHYGGDDARVNATVEPAKKRLAERKRSYEAHFYEGAGHGFLRQQAGREGANLRASQAAWPRTLTFLRKHLK